MRNGLSGSLVVCVSIVAAGIAAQQGRDAGASAPRAPLSGTGVIAGRLLTDTTNPAPVRRATVRLSGATGTGTRLVGTDDDGRFSFDALPAGTYTLSASKPGFVQTFYGSKHPGRGPGVPVAVAEGRRIDLALKMLPGAVVSGVVTGPRGIPAAGIPVTAVELRAGGATPVPSRATTDDRGVYRIFGLAPGQYVVLAAPRLLPVSAGRSVANAEVMGVSDAEVQWARRAGAGGVMGAAGAAPPPASGVVAYAPVFYPGTTDAATAGKVSLAAGEERTDVGFGLQIVPMARVAGSLLDQNGQALTSVLVSLFPKQGTQLSAADALVASGVVLPQATVSASGFSFSGVAPADYTLVARTGSRLRSAGPPPPDIVTLWSVTDLSVTGVDRTDLVLRLLPGVKVTGRIAFDRVSLTPPADLSAVDLSLVAVGSLATAIPARKATVDAAGTVTCPSVAPGWYTLRAIPPSGASGARWTLKSAMLGNRDLADGAFEIRGGSDVGGLVIAFTDHGAEISGRVVDRAGAAVTRYSIVVVTTDRSLWLPNARRITSATPATDGSFRIEGLPPGEYAMAAIEDIDTADLADATFLSQVAGTGLKIVLTDGEKKRQDLQVGG